MKIAIGNDHAAVEMKQEIRTYLEEKGYEVINFGTDTHESCNYPEYGEAVGRACRRKGRLWSPDLWNRGRNFFSSQ